MDKYLVITIADNMVVLIEDQQPIIRETEVILQDRELSNLNSSNCISAKVDDSTIPADWHPAIYSWAAGVWTKLHDAPIAVPTQKIFYLHHIKNKSTVQNNGIDSIDITLGVKETADIESETIVAASGPYGAWNLFWRNDYLICDAFAVQFTDGIASFAFKTTLGPGRISLSEAELPVFTVGDTIYRFRIATPLVIDILRGL